MRIAIMPARDVCSSSFESSDVEIARGDQAIALSVPD